MGSRSGKGGDTSPAALCLSDKELEVCGCCLELGSEPLLQCRSCSVKVHAECYGVVLSDKWVCSPCLSLGKSKHRLICAVCRQPGGALKPTNDDRWAHLCCAMWIPETWVAGGNAMQPIVGVDRILSERMKLRCVFCKEPNGCVQCTSGRCATSFHVLCGFRNGLAFTIVQRSSGVSTSALCLKHRLLEEKQTPSATASPCSSKNSSAGEEDYMCDVCHSGDVRRHNEIVICEGCELAVHQWCYGIDTIPKHDWYCQACRINIGAASCALCADTGGAVKQTDTGVWVHIDCALWTPRTCFGRPRSMDLIEGVSSLELNSSDNECIVCRSTSGHPVSCAEPGCPKRFHVRCARNDERRVEIVSLKKDGDVLPFVPRFDSKCSQSDLAFVIFCEEHHDSQLSVDDYIDDKRHESPVTSDADPPDCPSDNSSDEIPIRRRAAARASSEATEEDVESVEQPVPDDRTPVRIFWDDDVAPYFKPVSSDQISIADPYTDISSDPSFIIPPAFTGTFRVGSTVPRPPVYIDSESIANHLGLLPPAPSHSPHSPTVIVQLVTKLAAVLCQFEIRDSPELVAAISVTADDDEDEEDTLVEELRRLQEELADLINSSNAQRLAITSAMTDYDREDTAASIGIAERKLLRVFENANRWQAIRLALERGVRDVDVTTKPDAAHDFFNTSCRVCFGAEGTELNPIVFCEICGLAVHKCCYGIAAIPDDDWHCDACAGKLPVTQDAFECQLCPLGGFAYKPTDDEDYPATVHLTCALWNPVVHLPNVDTMTPVANVDQAIDASHCLVCGLTQGGTIACAFPGCPLHSHVTCAWEHGLYMRVTSSEGQIAFAAYCEEHTPDHAGGAARDRLGQQEVRLKARTHKPTSPHPNVSWQATSPRSRLNYNLPVVDESFALSTSLSPQEPRQLDREDHYLADVCAICFIEGQPESPLTSCSHCAIAVHLSCYQPNVAVASTRWRCRRCNSISERQKAVPCELCPRMGGAYQLTPTGKWAHVACTKWTENHDHKLHTCAICEQRQGVCIRCARPDCTAFIHPLCALFVGCWLRDAEDIPCALCPNHMPLPLLQPTPDSPLDMTRLYDRLSLVRTDLDEVRTVLDLVRRREKTKRSLYRVKIDVQDRRMAVLQASRAAMAVASSDAGAAPPSPPLTKRGLMRQVAAIDKAVEAKSTSKAEEKRPPNSRRLSSDTALKRLGIVISTPPVPPRPPIEQPGPVHKLDKPIKIEISRSRARRPPPLPERRKKSPSPEPLPPRRRPKSPPHVIEQFDAVIPQSSVARRASRRTTFSIPSSLPPPSPATKRRRPSGSPSSKRSSSPTASATRKRIDSTSPRKPSTSSSPPPLKRSSASRIRSTPSPSSRKRSTSSCRRRAEPMANDDRADQFIQNVEESELPEGARRRALEFLRRHRKSCRSAAPFRVNDVVLASQGGVQLFDCKVLGVNENGSCMVHYINWAKRYDEVVPITSLYRDTSEARSLQRALVALL